MNYTPVTHVIFDMDGLLINTEELYTLVTQEVLDDFDAEFTFDIKAKMMGMKPVAAAKLLLDELDLSERITPEEFHNRMKPLFPKYFPNAKLMPGTLIIFLFINFKIYVSRRIKTNRTLDQAQHPDCHFNWLF